MIKLRATKKFSTLELPTTRVSSMDTLEEMVVNMDITQGISAKAIVRKFSALDISSPMGSPTGEPPSKIARSGKKPQHRRPNFLIGIRLNCSKFKQHVESIQTEIKSSSPHLAKCMTSSRKLHLTSFVFCLSSQEDITSAIKCLHDNEAAIRSLMQSNAERSLSFDSLGRFNSNVLFAAPVQDTCLTCMRDISRLLARAYSDIGLLEEDEVEKLSSWKPHATIAKTSADRSKKGRGNKILPRDYENCSSTDVFNKERPVVVPLSTIDLLSMQETDEDGYYRTLASLSLVI